MLVISLLCFNITAPHVSNAALIFDKNLNIDTSISF